MCEGDGDPMEGLSRKSVDVNQEEKDRLHVALLEEIERIIYLWKQKDCYLWRKNGAYRLTVQTTWPVFREFLEVLKKSEHSEQDLENIITTCEHAEMNLPDCYFGNIITEYKEGFERRLEKKEEE